LRRKRALEWEEKEGVIEREREQERCIWEEKRPGFGRREKAEV
jgi:hypothetical protein